MKKRILIIMGRYFPGYKDGGPVRTIVNLVDSLGDEYDFVILTNDRDHGDKVPYQNIKINDWNNVFKANVYYVPPNGFKLPLIRMLAKDSDLVYLCGFFDDYGYKTLLLKRLGIIKKPVVIASMGSFSKGALAIKSAKKKSFITICEILGFFTNISWSVSSTKEQDDLKSVIGKKAICHIAQDLPRKISNEIRIKDKQSGRLKIVFYSRICKMKNLKYAIDIISNLSGDISFTILGIKEEIDYWNECEKLLNKLPSNVKWEYAGSIDSEKAVDTLQKFDLFLLPTFGENFGHAIFEALAAGCVTVISDTTPWIDFEENCCGNVIHLNDKDRFVNSLQKYVDMSNEEFMKISNNALRYALNKKNDETAKNGYREILG